MVNTDWVSLLANQKRTRLPMQEMLVQSLAREDPLEKRLAALPSVLAWKSHGQSSLAGYSPWGLKESDTTSQLNSNKYC